MRSGSEVAVAEPEPGMRSVLRVAARLWQRARANPLRVLLVALLMAASVVGVELIKERAFQPRYVMRVVESDRDARTAPRMKRQLREYVTSAVFSNGALQGLIEKHDLYPGIARKNPQGALDSFREDIEVEVYRNFFVEERSAHDAPRSARIAVSYSSANRELALAVTADLGDLVVAHEYAARKQQADLAAARAREELDRARERYLSERRRHYQRAALIDGQSEQRHLARVEGSDAMRWLETLERDVEIAEERTAALELGQRLETEQLGLTFETVDRGAIPRSAELEARDLIALGALVFVFGLPLAGLWVGAFSSTLVDGEDVRKLEIPLLAVVPSLTNKARRQA
jgi:hypothetical protein